MEEKKAVIVKCRNCGRIKGENDSWHVPPDDYLDQHIERGFREIEIVAGLPCPECAAKKFL